MPKAGIRVARWERDRLGYLQPFVGPKLSPHLISAPVATGGKPVAIFLNVGELGEFSQAKVSVLDEQLRPLAGFGLDAATALTSSGLRQRALWGVNDRVTHDGSIRVRVDFTGARPEDIKLYGIYVAPVP